MIDCLCFFFLFSLLTTKVHNYLLFVCCLLESGMSFRTKALGFDMIVRPNALGLDIASKPKSAAKLML